ncbi:MAG TPA: hypothetical protein VIP75_01605, partial [Acidothermales bacterium]
VGIDGRGLEGLVTSARRGRAARDQQGGTEAGEDPTPGNLVAGHRPSIPRVPGRRREIIAAPGR